VGPISLPCFCWGQRSIGALHLSPVVLILSPIRHPPRANVLPVAVPAPYAKTAYLHLVNWFSTLSVYSAKCLQILCRPVLFLGFKILSELHRFEYRVESLSPVKGICVGKSWTPFSKVTKLRNFRCVLNTEAARRMNEFSLLISSKSCTQSPEIISGSHRASFVLKFTLIFIRLRGSRKPLS